MHNASMRKHQRFSSTNLLTLSQSILRCDHAWAIRINQVSHVDGIRQFFAIISKIGDGYLWWITGLLLPVYYGQTGWQALWSMSLFGILAVSCYKLIKHFTSRPRPYIQHREIKLGCPALDQWSFPSGHTLHAVGFTILLCAYFPSLGIYFIPFTLLVAASRVILGLHYISDVLMGALLGILMSGAVLVAM